MPRESDFTESSLTQTVLQIVGLGGILLTALVAPNALRLFRDFGKGEWQALRRQEKQRIYKALERLRKRRLVRFIQKGEATFIQVTDKGKSYIRHLPFSRLRLPKYDRWDHLWRLVIFDIPELKKRQRDVLSDKLKRLGFLPLQKSVLAYPFPCQDEIDFITSFLGVRKHVLYLETDSLGAAEGLTRKYFSLL